MQIVWPEKETVIEPPKLQLRVLEAVSIGMPPITALVDPGDQGPAGVGIQAPGVGVPMAAVVAAMTAGFAGAIHIPKGIIFKKGIIFTMVPAWVPAITMGAGRNIREAGAAPMEQAARAPETTAGEPISSSFLQN